MPRKRRSADAGVRWTIRSVTVRERDKDRYGRMVGEVILPDGRSLNREMVRQGCACWYSRYAPHDDELARLEAEARAAHRGLRSQPGAVPPSEWRKGTVVSPTLGVIGNRKSHVYHQPNCRGAGVMKAEKRITFASATDAEVAGYRRAGDCR
jgi:micrococcal nuclease